VGELLEEKIVTRFWDKDVIMDCVLLLTSSWHGFVKL